MKDAAHSGTHCDGTREPYTGHEWAIRNEPRSSLLLRSLLFRPHRRGLSFRAYIHYALIIK